MRSAYLSTLPKRISKMIYNL